MNSKDKPADAARPKRAAKTERKVINLALQGGGSHGAFTWGVLDRLLEDDRLDFEGITATSSGAVNAVVLVDGLAEGGRDGARMHCSAIGRKFPTCPRAASSRPR